MKKYKVIFISNFMNHYQLDLSLEFYKLYEEGFCFIETSSVPTSRLKLGFSNYSDEYSFIKKFSKHMHMEEEIMLAEKVIFGSAPFNLIKQRILRDKLTFFYSERFFKKKNPINLLFSTYKILNHHWKYRKNANSFLLAVGKHTIKDFRHFKLYVGKTFRWGYFPKLQEDIKYEITKNEYINILWVGRFLDWKRPKDVLRLGLKLSKSEVKFKIIMIGEGKQKNKIQNQIKKYNLEKNIVMLDGMDNKSIHQKMLEADIYLFTSNEKEGWGVVLNEAMLNSCAVIANVNAGASSILISHRKDGFLYNSLNDLEELAFELINNPKIRENASQNAFHKIHNLWSPANAAFRFFKVTQNIESNFDFFHDNGPMVLEKNA